MSILSEHFTMANGVQIPKLGFGTWQTPNAVAPAAVKTALRVGYTHIDTARAYRNEAGVGQGVRDFGLPREQVFITTKIPAEIKTYHQAAESIESSLAALHLGPIDLLLIHAPKPWPEMFRPGAKRYFDENVEVWRAMTEAYERGDARAIGVSNFDVDDLENITSHSDVVPLANQIEFRIGHTQDEIVTYCQGRDILIEAYSPIGTGELLNNEEIAAVAAGCGKTVAQVCIRYALQKGCLPLPKSIHDEFIEQNAQVDFELTADEMATLDAIKDHLPAA